MPDATADNERKSLGRYYNASQFRLDSWNRLKNACLRLAEGRVSDRDEALVRDMLDQLAPFEEYWAFPGHHNLTMLRRLFETRDFERLATMSTRIVGALMSDSYRRKHLKLLTAAEADDTSEEDEDELEEDERSRRRPYFEVLFVDDLPLARQRQQRDELVKMRRDEDSFTYEPIFVPSFEDALIAVLFNHNIQSVVIRYGFRSHSKHNLPVLGRYLAQARCENLDEIEPQDYGILLADVIASIRPELDLFLVTDQSVEEIAGRVGDACRRVFYNRED